MFLSPPEIQHQDLNIRGRGYDRQQVDRLLEDVVSSYEQVWLERDDLRGELQEKESELKRYRELEHLLTDSLLVGQRAASQVQAEAEQEAEKVLARARVDAEKIVEDAKWESDHLNVEIQRLEIAEKELQTRYRAFLVEALEVLERRQAEAPAGEEEAPVEAVEEPAEAVEDVLVESAGEPHEAAEPAPEPAEEPAEAAPEAEEAPLGRLPGWFRREPDRGSRARAE